MNEPSPRILVLGAGSIGHRHALNLLKAGADVSVADPDNERAAAVAGATVFEMDLDHLDGFDGIVVASPTSLHHEHLAAALSTTARVMVEKPLATKANTIAELIEANGDRVMVGYNLRLHAPVEAFLELVDDGVAGSPRRIALWFGSYLPDWRPDTDYRKSYSARAELGGGVLLDAIHELDLLVRIAGTDLQVISATLTRLGDLEIDVEDYAHAVLRNTSSGAIATVELDYLSRTYRRGIEVIGSEGTIRLDWARDELTTEIGINREVVVMNTSVALSYEREAGVFVSWTRGGPPPPCGGAEGLASLRLADEIRDRAASAAR